MLVEKITECKFCQQTQKIIFLGCFFSHVIRAELDVD